jgi:small GTP-binding protein
MGILHIWDTVGQERFRALVPQYARDAHGALGVFSTRDRVSFEELESWLTLVQAAAPGVQLIVFGSANDRPEERTVSREEAQDFAAGLGLPYFEGSARTGEQVREAFEKMGELVMSARRSQPVTQTVPQGPPEADAKRKCC